MAARTTTKKSPGTKTATATAKKTTTAKAERPDLSFASAKALDTWLAKHHASSPGIWLLLAKKDSGVASVTYAEARDLGLTWGWIDGQAKRVDDTYYGLRFTPRGAKSVWSKINVERVAALTKAGQMHPAGQACVDAAQADGRWDRAYDPPSRATVPPDLEEALATHTAAGRAFATLDATNRFAVITRIQLTKTPAARVKKIADLVAMLARGDVPHPSRVTDPSHAKKRAARAKGGAA